MIQHLNSILLLSVLETQKDMKVVVVEKHGHKPYGC